MESPLLTDFQNRLLALAEDEWVHFRQARPIMGTAYERDVSFEELTSAVGRLSRLGFLVWKIRHNGKVHFRSRAPVEHQHNCSAAFSTSSAGKAYLALPRHVA
ncbi:hypothetical protein ACFFGH_34080 [Lysobacter korlensis]|uniref:Uncharacterized protein n=1 Tax=Lysobacter korlensis TaxID=553636 RepID=A0ABV6S0X9_9GAMM